MAQPGYTLPFVTVSLLLGPPSAQAEWQLGLAITGSTDTREAIESEAQLIPYVAWEGYGFHIGIDEVSYESNIRDDLSWSISLSDADSVDIASGNEYPMGIDRDSAVDVQLGVEVGFFPWVLEATVAQDVASTHRGRKYGLNAELSFPSLGGELSITHSLKYRDQQVMQHRYGVEASDVTNTTLTFDAEATTTYGLSVQYLYSITAHSAWVFQADWEAYPSSHKRSPLVSDTHEFSTVIGWIWSY